MRVQIKGRSLYCSAHLKEMKTSHWYPNPQCGKWGKSLWTFVSDHLWFFSNIFSQWLKPGIWLQSGCKHRANQAVYDGQWAANEAKLQGQSDKIKQSVLPDGGFQKPHSSVWERQGADRWDPSLKTEATWNPSDFLTQRETDSKAVTIWRSSPPRSAPPSPPTPTAPKHTHTDIWLWCCTDLLGLLLRSEGVPADQLSGNDSRGAEEKRQSYSPVLFIAFSIR